MRLLQTITADELKKLYYVQGLTLDAIVERLHCSRTSVHRRMRQLGIAITREEVNRRISKSLEGHPVSSEVRQAVSKSQKGKRNSSRTEFKKGQIPWNKGKQMPPGTGEKVAAKLRGRPTWNKGIPMHEWMPEESRAKRTSAILKTLGKRPTKPEQRIINITQQYALPYEYVGDGGVIIKGFCPDFINSNEAKKIVEVFGRGFHDPLRAFSREVPLYQQEPYRKALYASLGFDCLVFWDDEMQKLSDEEIATRIIKFTKSKHKPTPQLRFKEVM